MLLHDFPWGGFGVWQWSLCKTDFGLYELSALSSRVVFVFGLEKVEKVLEQYSQIV